MSLIKGLLCYVIEFGVVCYIAIVTKSELFSNLLTILKFYMALSVKSCEAEGDYK